MFLCSIVVDHKLWLVRAQCARLPKTLNNPGRPWGEQRVNDLIILQTVKDMKGNLIQELDTEPSHYTQESIEGKLKGRLRINKGYNGLRVNNIAWMGVFRKP